MAWHGMAWLPHRGTPAYPVGRARHAWQNAALRHHADRDPGVWSQRMPFPRIFKSGLKFQAAYEHFETAISGILLVVISVIIVYSLVLVVITIVEDFRAGVYFAQNDAIKDTFGLILGLLILIEFNHSIALAMRRRSGVLQVRTIILLAIIVIARKLILLNYEKTGTNTLLGLGGLALSLGALYWLLTDVERRRRPSAPTE
jgi:uncharacterized membrane protein (DUF373 family)